MSKEFTLGRNERLKSRKQIERIFAEGKSFAVNPFRIFYDLQPAIDNSQAGLQFGIGVSNRNFRKAVDRNRIKRMTREAWRLQKNRLKELVMASNKQLNVFFIYTAKELPDFVTVKGKVAVALKKLSDKVNENDPANS